METIELNLPFRGTRGYLHGTDLYNEMMKVGGERLPDGPMHWQFHALLRKQPDLVLDVEELAEWRLRPNYRGEGRFGVRENARSVVMVESERPVVERKDCNEVEVVSGAVVEISERTAFLPRAAVGDAIEKVVFLNKHLHFKVLPGVVEPWLFAKLELKWRLAVTAIDEVKLVLRQVLGNRFTKTEIFVNELSCGFIIFSTNK
jgi:hypothetical protein